MSEKDWEPTPQPEMPQEMPRQKQAELYIDDAPPPEVRKPSRSEFEMGEDVNVDLSGKDVNEDQEEDAA